MLLFCEEKDQHALLPFFFGGGGGGGGKFNMFYSDYQGSLQMLH